MQNFIPERIKNARKLRGLSMDALSLKMNRMVSKQAISKYETGKMNPSVNVMKCVAEALHLPLSYFKTAPVLVGDLNFRIDRNIPAQSVSRMISVTKDKIERYLKVESILGISQTFKNPLRGIKVQDKQDVEKCVAKLRSKWELGTMSVFSVYDMLESHCVKVIEFDCGVKHVIGFSTMINKNIPLVVINLSANVTTERKRFTALHELAHILLSFSEGLEENTKERLCNYFAGAMLCPAPVFEREIGESREHIALAELTSLKTRFGISVAAAVHRARDLGIISERYYNYIFDNYIHGNIMENGWGGYPICERTDRFDRLLQRIVAEGFADEKQLSGILDADSKKIIREMTILD